MFYSLSELIKAFTMANVRAALNGGLSIVTRRPASASNACDDYTVAPCCDSDSDCLEACDISMLSVDSIMPSHSASEGIQGRIAHVGEGFCSPDLRAGLAQADSAAPSTRPVGVCSCALAASSENILQEGIREREYRLAAGFCSPRQARSPLCPHFGHGDAGVLLMPQVWP